MGEGSVLHTRLCLGPEAREAWLTGVCIFLSTVGLMGEARTELVSHVPFLWQASAPGLRRKGGHGAIVLTLGTVRKQAPQWPRPSDPGHKSFSGVPSTEPVPEDLG